MTTKTAFLRERKQRRCATAPWYAELVHIALDFDDTLWPLHEFLAALPGAEAVRLDECSTYDSIVHQLGGWERFEEFHDHALAYETMSQEPLLEGVVESLGNLAAEGARFTVITARYDEATAAVERFLVENGIAPDRIVSCPSQEKPAWCLAHDVDVLVDDHPGTIRIAVELGLPVVARTTPWNRAVVEELGVPHADHWCELETLVRAALQR